MSVYDALMARQVARTPEAMIPWYLMAAFAYYHLDAPILTDAAFDTLAGQILASWDHLEHPHKGLLDADSLRAGSLLLAEDRYPEIARDAARRLAGEGSLAAFYRLQLAI